MKKRSIDKKLRLRKDTLGTLGQDAMGNVAGGGTARCDTRDITGDVFCIETTLAQGCVRPTTNCNDTQGCTGTCNFACTGTCTLQTMCDC